MPELLVIKKTEVVKIPLRSWHKIGVEKKDIIGIKDLGTELLLQGKKEGDCLLKIGANSYHVVVANQTAFNRYQILSNLVSKMPSLTLTFAEGFFRVRGRMDDAYAWLSIGQLGIDGFLIEAEIESRAIQVVEHFMNKRLQQEGYFPVKIFAAPYPTVRVAKTVANKTGMSEVLSQFGVNLKIDERRIHAEPLVRVEVQILEIRKSNTLQLGLEWPSQLSAQLLPDGILSLPPGKSLNMTFFEQTGLGRILAAPVLLAKSGSEADFFAGGEFPIKSKTKQTQTVIWKKYGIGLKIKPISDADGKISIEMRTEVSTIDAGEKIDGIPSLFTNTLNSQFDLNSSQTIALSGLLKKVGGESLKQWPGLGDLPILGALFQSQDYQEDKTELIVLVTPRIVEN